MWTGLLLGLGEGTLVLIKRFQRPELLFFGPDLYWMAPVADALLLGGLGLLLVVAGRIHPGARHWPRALALYLFLALLTFLLQISGLHPLAAIVLALGAASQLGPRAGRWFPHLPRLVRLTLPALLVAVGLLAGGIRGAQWWQEHRALASGRPARASGTNVLLLILDTVRREDLSLYGYSRQTTPRLDAWARRGVRFDHAFSTASWTLVSHASIFTGRLPHDLSADWLTPLDKTWPTLAEKLAAAGYRTGGFVANVEYASAETGLARGFDRYEDYEVRPGQLALSSTVIRRLTNADWFRRLIGTDERLNRKSAARVNRAFFDWLDRPSDRPFFGFLNYFDAHSPYYPPEAYARPFRTKGVPPNPSPDRAIPKTPGAYTPAEVQGARDSYDGAIAYIDAQIGRLLDELDRRGLLDRTIVVITADHGEEFNEHGLIGHGNSLYRDVLEVPLVIVHRGSIPPAATIEEPVSLRDLPATILDLLNLPQRAVLPGRSLTALWSPGVSGRADTVISELHRTPRKPAWIPTSKGEMISALEQNERYILNGDGREELYDFTTDLHEQRDLSRDPARLGDLERFRRLVTEVRKNPRQ